LRRGSGNPKKTAAEWFAKSKADGNIAPQPKLANEKPKGQTVDYDELIKSWPGHTPEALAQPISPAGRRSAPACWLPTARADAPRASRRGDRVLEGSAANPPNVQMRQ
jgi:hypothetical protein